MKISSNFTICFGFANGFIRHLTVIFVMHAWYGLGTHAKFAFSQLAT